MNPERRYFLPVGKRWSLPFVRLGVRLAGGRTFSCFAKKKQPKRRRPQVARLATPTPLRYSKVRAACETRLRLRQRKPKAPGPSPLLGAPHGDPKGGMVQAVLKLSGGCGRPGKMAKNRVSAALCIPPPPNPRHSRAGALLSGINSCEQSGLSLRESEALFSSSLVACNFERGALEQ